MTWLYAGFIIVTAASALYLNIAGKLQLQKHWRPLLIAFLVVCVPFIIEDIYATAQGHWSFSDDYTLGSKLFNLPIEEVAFFIVVPLVMTCVWILVRDRTPDKKTQLQKYLGFDLVIGVLVYALFGGEYSQILAVALAVFSVILLRSGLPNTLAFWKFQMWLFLAFFIANTLLTWPPIVSYGDEFIIGLRIGTIPLEDFAYNFILINGFILVYEKAKTLYK